MTYPQTYLSFLAFESDLAAKEMGQSLADVQPQSRPPKPTRHRAVSCKKIMSNKRFLLKFFNAYERKALKLRNTFTAFVSNKSHKMNRLTNMDTKNKTNNHFKGLKGVAAFSWQRRKRGTAAVFLLSGVAFQNKHNFKQEKYIQSYLERKARIGVFAALPECPHLKKMKQWITEHTNLSWKSGDTDWWCAWLCAVNKPPLRKGKGLDTFSCNKCTPIKWCLGNRNTPYTLSRS